jgi:hypothetical protein
MHGKEGRLPYLFLTMRTGEGRKDIRLPPLSEKEEKVLTMSHRMTTFPYP